MSEQNNEHSCQLQISIEDDHLRDKSPEMDCCWRLTFRQPSSESSRVFTMTNIKRPDDEKIFFILLRFKASNHVFIVCILNSAANTLNEIIK